MLAVTVCRYYAALFIACGGAPSQADHIMLTSLGVALHVPH